MCSVLCRVKWVVYLCVCVSMFGSVCVRARMHILHHIYTQHTHAAHARADSRACVCEVKLSVLRTHSCR